MTPGQVVFEAFRREVFSPHYTVTLPSYIQPVECKAWEALSEDTREAWERAAREIADGFVLCKHNL